MIPRGGLIKDVKKRKYDKTYPAVLHSSGLAVNEQERPWSHCGEFYGNGR